MKFRRADFMAVGAAAIAPGFAPELAPIAARHKADFAAVEPQQKTALACAQYDYLAALGFAGPSAAGPGDHNAAAIGKEGDLPSLSVLASSRSRL